MAEVDVDAPSRARSPNFPYINLTVALERAAQLYESSKGNPVRLADAASDWKLSATSSGTQRVAAALISFGLLADEGAGEERRLRLTEDAKRILGDKRPGVREGLLSEAALRPPSIREYYIKWKHRRPSDSHAISHLKYDSRFTDEAARMFLRVFDDAISYVDDAPNAVDQETDVAVASASPQPFEAPESAGSRDSVPLGAAAAIRGEEWLKVKVSRETDARIYVEGAFGKPELQRLIKLLNVQLEIMDDDF